METVEVFVAHDGRNFAKSALYTTSVAISIDSVLARVFPPASSCSSQLQSCADEAKLPSRLYLRCSVPREFYERDVESPARRLFPELEKESEKDGGKADEKDDEKKRKTDRLRYFKEENTLLWVSTAGNVTPLHYDRCHGVLCQVVGHKRVLLVCPEETSNVYARSADTGMAHTSAADLHAAVDEGRPSPAHPSLARCEVLYVLLAPGEALYIPPGWWHHVTTLSPSVSLTWAWDPLSSEPLPANMYR